MTVEPVPYEVVLEAILLGLIGWSPLDHGKVEGKGLYHARIKVREGFVMLYYRHDLYENGWRL